MVGSLDWGFPVFDFVCEVWGTAGVRGPVLCGGRPCGVCGGGRVFTCGRVCGVYEGRVCVDVQTCVECVRDV